jgi:hypothetical protein
MRASILVVAAILSTPANSQEHQFFLLPGGNFLGLCREDQSACMFYVAGVFDTANWLNVSQQGDRLICAPVSVDAMQLMRMAVKAVEDDPSRHHLPAADAILGALIRAFPCRE